MMLYFIDFNGFYLHGEFIFKELAYYCVDTSETKVFHFSSNRNFTDLSRKEKNVVQYYESQIHGIPWDVGYSSLSELKNMLPLTKYDVIILNRSNKKRLLQSITHHTAYEVICLPEITQHTMNIYSNSYNFFCISSFHSSSSRCALKNVHIYYNICKSWLSV